MPQVSKCAQKFPIICQKRFKNSGLMPRFQNVPKILKKFSKIRSYAPIFKMCSNISKKKLKQFGACPFNF
jgi:hypothetical protein